MIDISVIIPIYKGKKYITYWLDILSENFRRLEKKYNVECELIFINDYPDEKIELLYNKKNLYIYNLEKNRGIQGARVFGYYKAVGNYVVFLDQDDKISEDYLLSQRENIGNADAIVCNGYIKCLWMQGKRTIYTQNTLFESIQDSKNYFVQRNEILSPGQVLILRKSVPKLWLTEILKENGADDYFLWILMRKRGCKFKVNYRHLYTHMEYGGNTSYQSENMHRSILEMISVLKREQVLEKKQIDEIYRKECELGIKARRYVNMVRVYDYWMYLKIRDIKLEKYFNNHNYKVITIYGMNYIGNRLYDELNNTSVKVIFGVDKVGENIVYEVPILNINSSEFAEKIQDVDVIVVTAIAFYQQILAEIRKVCNNPVVSIEEILLELMNEFEE